MPRFGLYYNVEQKKTPIQIKKSKEFENLFHVGEHSIEFQLEQTDLPLFPKDSDPNSFPYELCLIVEVVTRRRTSAMYIYDGNPDNFDNDNLYLLISNESDEWRLKTSKYNEFDKLVFDLGCSEKRSRKILLKLASLENIDQFSTKITFDIWLLKTLEKNNLVENPFECMRLIQKSVIADVHSLMTKFFFSLDTKQCVLQERDSKNIFFRISNVN